MKEMTRPRQRRRRQQRQRSKQKKNCGRPGNTQSRRRNKTFSRVFLYFSSSLFSAFFVCAFVLLIHIYLCIDKYRKHTHTEEPRKEREVEVLKFHTLCALVGSHKIYVINTNRKKARAALSTFAQLTTRTSNNNNNDINIVYYYYTRFDRRPSPSYQCERT